MKVSYLYGDIKWPYKEKEKNVLFLVSDTELNRVVQDSLYRNTLFWAGAGERKKGPSINKQRATDSK